MVALLEPLEAPVHPIEALRRIAFLLERTRAGTYRVEAFRNAARTLRTVGADELDERVEAGTLQEIPGIGKSTAGVVEEAVRGEVPAYLASLQEKSGGPLVDGGQDLYAALRGDCHLHSDWSDGGSPIDEMVVTGIELGHDWMVLTDHSPQLRVANGLTVERLTKQLAVVDGINRSLGERFRLLKGIEVDILDDGSLDQTEEMLGRLDLVTASVHSKLRMNAAPMTKRMVAAVSNPRVNVLGHCTGRLVEGSRGNASAVGLRRHGRLRGLRRARHRRRDQQPPRALRPARRAGAARPRHRLHLLHRLRRARPRPARHEGLRLRARRAARCPLGPDRHHVGRRARPRVGEPGAVSAVSRVAVALDGVLRVDPSAAEAPFEQVRRQLAAAIGDGRLAAGTRLPTIRGLADELGPRREHRGAGVPRARGRRAGPHPGPARDGRVARRCRGRRVARARRRPSSGWPGPGAAARRSRLREGRERCRAARGGGRGAGPRRLPAAPAEGPRERHGPRFGGAAVIPYAFGVLDGSERRTADVTGFDESRVPIV